MSDTQEKTNIVETDFESAAKKLKGHVTKELVSEFSISAGIRALQIVLNHVLMPQEREAAIQNYLNSWEEMMKPRLEEKKEKVRGVFKDLIGDGDLDSTFVDAMKDARRLIDRALRE